MRQTTVRVTESTRALLRHLAAAEGPSMQIIIATALEAYRRERFLKAVNARYASLRDDAAAWARVAEERVALLGARDLDDAEREALVASAVTWLPPSAQRADPAALDAALAALAGRAERLYLHLDLDVIDPAELRANRYACEGGLSVDEVVAVIRAAGERFELAAVGLTAYDPAVDAEGRGPAVAARLLAAVAESAGRGQPVPVAED